MTGGVDSHMKEGFIQGKGSFRVKHACKNYICGTAYGAEV